jgi:Domain of unknown function (DUF4145)
MKCPHCQKNFHPEPKTFELGHHGSTVNWKYIWRATVFTCPACAGPIVFVDYKQDFGGTKYRGEQLMAFPKTGKKAPAPPEVPAVIAKDFNEASVVIKDSPQASAALSRKCLQHVLTERGVTKNDNLSVAIDEALKTGLPSHLAENLDAIRNIGNFAAHPQKSQHSGEILPVEPEEAEWNLEVLELLFDFYYVQPSRAAARRAELNAKLLDAGKKPMKSLTESKPDESIAK